MLKLILAVIFSVGFISELHAATESPYTTKILVDFCKSLIKFQNQNVSEPQKQEANFCAGYFEAYDGLHSMLSVKKIERMYCIPDGTMRIDQIKKVIEALEKHPDILNSTLPTPFTILSGYIEAYPCKKQEKK